jgi:hypothetical protein
MILVNRQPNEQLAIFGVLTVVWMKAQHFWNTTPYHLVSYRLYRGIMLQKTRHSKSVAAFPPRNILPKRTTYTFILFSSTELRNPVHKHTAEDSGLLACYVKLKPLKLMEEYKLQFYVIHTVHFLII